MNLYSRSKILASAVLVLLCAAAFTTAVAQRRKAHKLRATAVLEVTTDSALITFAVANTSAACSGRVKVSRRKPCSSSLRRSLSSRE